MSQTPVSISPPAQEQPMAVDSPSQHAPTPNPDSASVAIADSIRAPLPAPAPVVVDNAPQNRHAHTYNESLYTTPSNDPELNEALRQLKAGEAIPELEEADMGIGPDGQKIQVHKRRAAYTREQKLAAIYFANNTYRLDARGSNRLIPVADAALILHVHSAVLASWMRDVARIEAMEPGSQKRRGRPRKHPLDTTPLDRPEKIRKTLSRQDLRGDDALGTMSSILSSYPKADSSSQHCTAGQTNGTGAHIHGVLGQPPAGTPVRESGLVSYDLPSFLQSVRRKDQRVCSAMDESSDVKQSDVQFSTFKNSRVEDSTVVCSQITASLVHRGSSVYQSTVKSSTIGEESEVSSCSLENSMVVNSRIANCTIVNSQITGGEHAGKTFINTRIIGNQPTEGPKARTERAVTLDNGHPD